MEEPSPAGPAESLDEIPGNVEKKMYLQNISEYCIQIRYSERDDLGEFDEESQVEFKIVLTRSGEYECIQERAFGSWFDTTLTTKGHADILVASKALKMGQYEFDLAFCSVLKRCKESLKLILNHLELDDIEIHECWELNERHYGALTVAINNDLERKIADAFLVFDHAGNKTVDVREIGTIIRSFGCVPTEEEIQEILLVIEKPATTGSVHLSNFLPHMTKIINEHKLQPAPPDKLLEAFHVLDPEGVGYIEKEQLTKLMMQQGEPFSQDEIDEMMATACDPQTQTIPYEYYINQLMYIPTEDKDLYKLADDIEAAKPKKAPGTMSAILKAAQELENIE